MPGSSSFSDFAIECNNSLLFQVGDIRKCHNITVHDDDTCEWLNGTDEHFTANLVVTSGSDIATGQQQSHIHIDDSSETECGMWCLLINLSCVHNLYFTQLYVLCILICRYSCWIQQSSVHHL